MQVLLFAESLYEDTLCILIVTLATGRGTTSGLTTEAIELVIGRVIGGLTAEASELVIGRTTELVIGRTGGLTTEVIELVADRTIVGVQAAQGAPDQ